MHSEYEDKEVTRIEKEDADKYRRNLRRKIENIGYTDKYSPVNGFLVMYDFIHIVPRKYYAIAM